MTRPFPRTLIVSHNPFSSTLNNGKTLAMLFGDWPSERLAQIYLHPMRPDSRACSRYWRTTEIDLWRSFWRRGARRAPGGPVEPATAEHHCPITHASKLFARLRGLNSPSLECLRECAWLGRRWYTDALRRWIHDFQPELLFFQTSGSVFSYRLVLTLAHDFKLPLVLHVTDDYLGQRAPPLNPLGRWRHRALLHSARDAFAQSALRLVIGDAMADDYRQRYGGECFVQMNCVDKNTATYAPPRPSVGRPVRLVFLGGLHLQRWRAVRAIGQVLGKLQAEGIACEFLLYTNPMSFDLYGKKLAMPACMRFAGWAAANELFDIMAQADVLVHVESFDRRNRAYTRLAISTKIPEYLMAGRCVFAYGPGELASMRYLKDNAVGVAVTEPQAHALERGLRQVLEGDDFRAACGQRARQLALARHEASAERERFRQLLCQAINGCGTTSGFDRAQDQLEQCRR